MTAFNKGYSINNTSWSRDSVISMTFGLSSCKEKFTSGKSVGIFVILNVDFKKLKGDLMFEKELRNIFSKKANLTKNSVILTDD